MNNSDQPVHPTMVLGGWDSQGNRDTSVINGLTKREYFAAMAMQALISKVHNTNGYPQTGIITDAIFYADSLLKQLEQKPDN